MTHINKNKFKDEIITTAELIISQQGYQNLSARKISTQIGCAVGSLYNAYSNLNDIYLRVNQRSLNRLHDLFKSYLDNSSGSTLEKLLGLTDIYMQFWESDFQLANCLFNYSQPEKTPLPQWAQHDVDLLFSTIIGVIESQKLGLNENPKLMVAVLWAGLHGIANLCFSGKIQVLESQTHFSLARSFVQNYFMGLTNTK